MAGSPATEAKPVPTTPPIAPAARPQSSRLRSMALVAGETEQVPPVVHPLVDHVPGGERGGALLHADHVDQHEQRDDDQRPRPELAQRDGGRMDCPGQRGTRGGDVRHGEPPGDDASPTTVVSDGPKSWLPDPSRDRSQWRDRAGLTPTSTRHRPERASLTLLGPRASTRHLAAGP